MESNPMLDEVWGNKDAGARAVGEDVRSLRQNIRNRAAGRPHPGPTAHDREELRPLVVGMAGLKFSKDVIVEF